MPPPLILVINPGSTSTRTALFRGAERLADSHLECPAADLAPCKSIADQVPLRRRHVEAFLAGLGPEARRLEGIAARGAPLRPVPGGVYRVDAAMLADARSDRFIEHVSKAACQIAAGLSAETGAPAFVVDPISTDEYDPVSRISGLKELPRQPLTHALNMKAVARLFAKELGRPYASLNLITAHLGGGCSLAVHRQGRMVDSVDANGEGPFSPERSGGLRVDSLARLVAEGGMDFRSARGLLTRKGGLMSHCGTADAREVERRIHAGDAGARQVYEALAYQVAKHICGLAAAVAGRVDGVLLTGGLAHSAMITTWISERVGFLGTVRAYPGEREMEALAAGVQRVLAGEEAAQTYPGSAEKPA